MGPGLRAGGRRTGSYAVGARLWWLLALALLVAQVLADHHDPPMTADHLALVADLLDARLDLHGLAPSPSWPTCTGRRSGRGTGRTGTARPRLGLPEGCGCSAAASCR